MINLSNHCTQGCSDECEGIHDSGDSGFTCSGVITNPRIYCKNISGFDGIGVTVGISSQRRRRNIFHRDVSGDASIKLLCRDASGDASTNFLRRDASGDNRRNLLCRDVSRDDRIITLLIDTSRDNRRNVLRRDVSRDERRTSLLRGVSRDDSRCTTVEMPSQR